MCEQEYPRLRVNREGWVTVETSPDSPCDTGLTKEAILPLKMGDERWGIGCVWSVERVGTEVFRFRYGKKDDDKPYYFSEAEVKHA